MSLEKSSRRVFLARSLAGVAALHAATPSRAPAQSDAGGRITIFVGFPPGGTPDLVARVAAENLRARLGRAVVVENRTGASGQIAMQAAKTASAAGTTLVLSPAEMMTLRPHIDRNLPYDPFGDFTVVGSLSSSPFGLAVGPLAPVKSVRDFVDWCKANPAKSTYGTPGAGTPQHFLGVMFARAAGIEFTHVPYRGGALALQDLMSGQIAALISAFPLLVTQQRPGGLTVLAGTGRERNHAMPDVPTFAELGFSGLEAEGVLGLYAAARTSPHEVARLTEAVSEIVRTDAFAQAVEKFGQRPHARAPSEFLSALRAESERWRAIVAETGFKSEE